MTLEKSHKLTSVFGTSRDIPETYVTREGIDDRFLNDITRDKHLVIHGSSKQGKTCLRKYHLNPDEYIVVQCTREATKPKLYEMILKQAGIPCQISNTKTVSGAWKLNVKIGGEVKIPLLSKASGETAGEYGKNNTEILQSNEFDIDPEDPNDIARVLKEDNFSKYIVIEDFHYLDEEVQKSFAIDLKVFHENSNLIFIVVGVWLEANRLTLYNGDLSGRLATINVDKWTDEELANVVAIGESLLNISFPEKLKEIAVKGCQENVGLLQEIIYRICEKYSIWSTQEEYKEIGTVEDVETMLKAVSDEQAARYRNFLSRFAEGLGQTQLEMYKWLLHVVIHAPVYELRRGIKPNVIFQRIRNAHPSADTIQQANVVQALDRVGKVQFKHGLQPLIIDYSNGEMMVVDANFLVFLQTHTKDELIEYIGMQVASK